MIQKKNVTLKDIDTRLDSLNLTTKSLSVRSGFLEVRMEKVETKLEILIESVQKTGVLLERLEGKFDLSLEGYSSLKERADKVEDRVTVLEGNRA
jgi:hypothetical protein